MIEEIKLYDQNSLKIMNIYFDPYNVTEELHDAKYIFITHSHYDHFSIDDIKKVKNEETIIVIPADCFEETIKIFNDKDIFVVEPNKEYSFSEIHFKTIPMYNVEKKFHEKDKDWSGYLIYLNNTSYYIVGDSDVTEELLNTKCDVLFIPIGGKYTMNLDEAVEATISINPKYVIPVHYGTIVGDIEDGEIFKNKIPDHINCILKK